MLEAGFGRTDITPRVGVELCGYGAFIHRYSRSVRDRLSAKAIALRQGGQTAIVVACDIIGVDQHTTDRVREIVGKATGVPAHAILVSCTHTHSGPNTLPSLTGWGVLDWPYYEMLPDRIAAACVAAFKDLAPATVGHAEVPCEGIALNREYDKDSPPLAEVSREDWRPAKPELTDTTCHVLTVKRGQQLAGFLAYFSCHPVVGSSRTFSIHGDFVGIAMTLLERENPGSFGLFLQGAQGDINSCVVHKDEAETHEGLDILASRFARAVRRGIAEAKPIEIDRLTSTLRDVTFTTRPFTEAQLQEMLDKHAAVIHAEGADATDGNVRLSTVYVLALRELMDRRRRGESMHVHTQLQGIRLGPVAMIANPLEVFHAIKRDVLKETTAPITLFLGIANDELGYAVDRDTVKRGGYAADQVPFMLRKLPFANIHDELVREALEIDRTLANEPAMA